MQLGPCVFFYFNYLQLAVLSVLSVNHRAFLGLTLRSAFDWMSGFITITWFKGNTAALSAPADRVLTKTTASLPAGQFSPLQLSFVFTHTFCSFVCIQKTLILCFVWNCCQMPSRMPDLPTASPVS